MICILYYKFIDIYFYRYILKKRFMVICDDIDESLYRILIPLSQYLL
jgi:hypothetical protein